MGYINRNKMDEIQQVGVEGLKYAVEKDMAAVIMEPLRGGYLLNNVPQEVHNLISQYPEEDLSLVRRIRGAYEAKKSIGCTGWRYCMPCPQGVTIPEIFKLYNSYQLMKLHWVDNVAYRSNLVPSSSGADQCVECGLCAEHCPQTLKIPELLKEVHAEFMR